MGWGTFASVCGEDGTEIEQSYGVVNSSGEMVGG
jgi:hypothetical protein